MQNPWSKNLSGILLYALTAIVFALVCYRAATLSMTHDESGTYLAFHSENIFEFFTTKWKWHSANNHLLNSILFQQSVDVFGFSDLTTRLPNVLSFLLYAYSSIKLGQLLFSKSHLVQILFFALICLNPYALDFFSLNRGYGLSLAFQMFGIYMVYRYLSTRNIKWFCFSLISFIFSALSLLSVLILLPAVIGSVLCFEFLETKKINLKVLATGTLACILAGIIFYVPITALSELNEFGFGTDTIISTLGYYVQDSLIGIEYFGDYTVNIFKVLFALLLLAALVLPFRRKAQWINKQLEMIKFSHILFIVVILAIVSSCIVLGSRYPQNRKGIFLLPFLGIIFSNLFYHFRELKFLQLFTIGFAGFLLIHFCQIRINQTWEWYYDYRTKDFISEIVADSKGEEVSLATHWHYHPTSTYYVKTKNIYNVNIASYTKAIVEDKVFDYYIAQIHHNDILSDQYEQWYKQADDMWLIYKRKKVAKE